jgi:hypothetical protein
MVDSRLTITSIITLADASLLLFDSGRKEKANHSYP